MSETQLPSTIVNNPALAKYSEDDFNAVAVSADFLPRFQLFGSNSEACKEGKIGIGHYGLVVGDDIVDLGKEIDVYVVTWRPKALEMADDAILAVHDPKSPDFERIKKLAGVKDSGCMYGPEFLLYVPSQEKFATFFAGSKTSRRESKNIRTVLGCAATFKSHLIKTAKYSWHGPVVTPCSSPLDQPDEAELAEQVEKFSNPPAPKIETADTESRAR